MLVLQLVFSMDVLLVFSIGSRHPSSFLRRCCPLRYSTVWQRDELSSSFRMLNCNINTYRNNQTTVVTTKKWTSKIVNSNILQKKHRTKATQNDQPNWCRPGKASSRSFSLEAPSAPSAPEGGAFFNGSLGLTGLNRNDIHIE